MQSKEQPIMRKLGSILFASLFAAAPLATAEGLVTYKTLSLETAQQAAQAALDSCRDSGYQVAVAVVDRSGVLQVLLRDRFAGPHTPDTAHGKAWTAVSFRTSTSELAEMSQSGMPQSGMRDVSGALALGGGLTIEAAGSIVGGIGVSGAPGGNADDACAEAGIEAIADAIDF